MKNKEYISIIKMIEYIEKSVKYTEGYDFEKFSEDDKTIDATIFAISQIGELVKNISRETKKKYPKIEWNMIKGLRNRIVHDYEGINVRTIWYIVENDIETLKQQLQEIIKKEKNEEIMFMKTNEKGSVTIIVLTTVFFLMIILGVIFTTMASKRKSQLAEFEQLKEVYDGDMQEAYEARSDKLTIKNKNGQPIELNNIADYYGHETTYNGKTWQLFLVDKDGNYSNGEPRIWLQLKENVGAQTLTNNYEITGITDEKSVLWQVNPDLNRKFGSTIRGKSTTELNTDAYKNFKGIAYLCNKENWKNYVATADISKDVYAIGGASAEMFCESYNQKRGKSNTASDYFEAKAFNKNNTYGYLFKPKASTAETIDGDFSNYTNNSGEYEIKATTGSGIYRTGTTSSWLSSTSAQSSQNVVTINPTNGRIESGSIEAYTIRPVLSLPKSYTIQLTN